MDLSIKVVGEYTQRRLTMEFDVVDAVAALLEAMTKGVELAGGGKANPRRYVRWLLQQFISGWWKCIVYVSWCFVTVSVRDGRSLLLRTVCLFAISIKRENLELMGLHLTDQ